MRFFFIIIISLIYININLLAQEIDSAHNSEPIFYFGAYLGLDFNHYFADFDKLPGYANCCPKFTDGNGMGFSLGLATNYPLSNRFSLDTRIGLSSLNGLLSKEQIIGFTEIRNTAPPFETTDITNAISNYEIQTHIQTIGIEPAIKYSFDYGITGLMGFRVSFLNSSTFDQKEKLISPNNVVFKESGSLVRNEFKLRDIPEVNSLQLHYIVGASYKAVLKNSIYIEPDLRYYLPLSNISSVDWSVSQLQFSVAALFPLYKPKELKIVNEEIIKRDTSLISILGLDKETISLVSSNEELISDKIDENTMVERKIITEKYERRVPQASILKANLVAIGVNPDGTEVKDPTIVIEETEIYETFPLLPYIFFNEGEDKLSNTAQKLITKASTSQFKEEMLDQNTYEVYYNLLNVIGYRMKKYPNAKITIVGNNNNMGIEKGNKGLSKSRAISVMNYLTETWGIDPNRINIQARNLPKKHSNNDYSEGLEENRRAEIYSDNFDILKPITIMELNRTATPPKIKIIPEIQSDIGIKKWKLGISQNNQLIKEFTDKDNDILWDIEKGKIPELETPIDISLNVEDLSGKKVDISKPLEIKQLTIKKKREELVNDKRIEKFALILFDYDRAELKQEHKQILSDIKARIKPESIVTISGYADATGEKDYNKDLAAKRTKNVVKELGLSENNVIIHNIGSDKLLFDNSTSYGRSFCRTVTILIETPINGK